MKNSKLNKLNIKIQKITELTIDANKVKGGR